MKIERVRIYNDGVEIDNDGEDKIRQIASALKTLSHSPDVGLRIVKSGRIYEGLLWGRVDNIPLGAYNRGSSANQVFARLYGRINKLCLKNQRARAARERTKSKQQTYNHSPMAIAA